MRFPGIRLVEQTEQEFTRFESVFFFKKKKKTSNCISRALLLIKAPTKTISLVASERYFDMLL